MKKVQANHLLSNGAQEIPFFGQSLVKLDLLEKLMDRLLHAFLMRSSLTLPLPDSVVKVMVMRVHDFSTLVLAY